MADLDVRGLVVRYGAVRVVDGISFGVAEGEFVSLLGPSGCGKTTTLRCIAGLEDAAAGEIRIGPDLVVARGRDVPPEKRGVNMVFQSYAVWPHMTVADNVGYGVHGSGKAARVAEALRLVGLQAFAARYGTELSGGQQQRVAVARAVVTEPRLLLFDEPLSNLDAGLRERMRTELVQLQRRLGRTSVYVTHDQGEAMAMSDRIILMNGGRIVQQGTPRDLYERPASRFAAEFIGTANLLEGTAVAADGPGTLVRLPGGLELHADGAATPGTPVLLCLRPENLLPVPAGTPGSFPATVETVSYGGARLDCELAAGPVRLRATLPARPNAVPGDTLHLLAAPGAAVLIPTETLP